MVNNGELSMVMDGVGFELETDNRKVKIELDVGIRVNNYSKGSRGEVLKVNMDYEVENCDEGSTYKGSFEYRRLHEKHYEKECEIEVVVEKLIKRVVNELNSGVVKWGTYLEIDEDATNDFKEYYGYSRALRTIFKEELEKQLGKDYEVYHITDRGSKFEEVEGE